MSDTDEEKVSTSVKKAEDQPVSAQKDERKKEKKLEAKAEAKASAVSKSSKMVKIKNRWRQVVSVSLKCGREKQIKGRHTVEIPEDEITGQMRHLEERRIIQIT